MERGMSEDHEIVISGEKVMTMLLLMSQRYTIKYLLAFDCLIVLLLLTRTMGMIMSMDYNVNKNHQQENTLILILY